MSDMDFSAPKIIGFCIGHEGVVTALHFTDETDNAVTMPSLISGSDIGEIFFWNLLTQRTYHRFAGHNGKMILYLCYYKSSLISQGRDGNIHVWKFSNDEWNIISSFKSSSYGFCTSILFPTESNTYLVAPTGDQSSLTFYDYETSKVLHNYTHKTSPGFNENREMCMCIKLFEEEMKIFLLLGYDSGCLSLWDYESSKEISKFQCHPEVILCLDFDSKHRNRGISGSVDKNIQIWTKTEDNRLLKVRQVTITNPGINAVKIRDDGKIVITAGQDGNIRIFSWKGFHNLAMLSVHRQAIFSLKCRTEPFGRKNLLVFASGAKDMNICLIAVPF